MKFPCNEYANCGECPYMDKERGCLFFWVFNPDNWDWFECDIM